MSIVTMRELELGTAKLLPARETLSGKSGQPSFSYTNVAGNTSQSQTGLISPARPGTRAGPGPPPGARGRSSLTEASMSAAPAVTMQDLEPRGRSARDRRALGTRVADGGRVRARPGPPRLAEGVELLGQYQDSGCSQPSLVRRADGQVVQMSPLLYRVACPASQPNQAAFTLRAIGERHADHPASGPPAPPPRPTRP